MGKALAESLPECKEVFAQANEALGYDLARICFEGPLEELTKSSNTQPAIFVHSMAAYRAFQKVRPDITMDAAAGLSSGEWAALHLAGVLSFGDALRVLQARGQFMQEACEQEPGGMLSVIGLDVAALEPICEQTGLEIANLNSPGQTVLSGPRDVLAAAEALAKEAGAKRAIPLNVAGAFHSRLMKPAAERLGAFLEGIELSAPQIPVLSNVTGGPHEGPEQIRTRMVEQVTGSVQWVSNISWMQENGVNSYIECGPGKVLRGLVKRIDKQAALHNIQDPASLESTLGSLDID